MAGSWTRLAVWHQGGANRIVAGSQLLRENVGFQFLSLRQSCRVSRGRAAVPRDPQGSKVASMALDTSYVAVVDRHGNAFSATPSDVSTDTPVMPGTGLAVSSRGSQGWLDPG